MVLKKNLSLLFITCIAASYSSFGQSKTEVNDNTITINGVLKNVNYTVSQVFFMYDNIIDSVEVIDNKYSYITKAMNEPFLMTLYSNSYSDFSIAEVVPFLLDGKAVTITSVDSFKNLNVVGSTAYTDYIELEKMNKPYYLKNRELNQKINSANDLNERNDYRRALNKEATINGLKYINFIERNSLSPALMYALLKATLSLSEENYPLIKDIYDKRTESEKSTNFGKRIKKSLFDDTPRVNDQTKNFTLLNMRGDSISLDKYKGKYVILDFWASWCGPCRKENKYLLEAYNKYKNKNFDILSVSLDIDMEAWKKAIQKDGLIWEQLIDDNKKTQQLYKVSAIPQNFLIDPQGKIIEKELHEKRLLDVLYTIFEK